ncbi:hypothetical protein L3X38_042378 [Prunus dulcis]|uniref:Uncharacterized protein n=1 Tax=Prunus dulcis TaxID=3755 RepID=A0AAD4UW67_PRUDU|nr:hypothetical protein L3X38_042378 [Prunus dulcis]
MSEEWLLPCGGALVPPRARLDEEDRTYGDGEPITLREFDVPVILYFIGSDCIEGFLQWVADVEEIFDSIGIPEEKMVKIVASPLEDDVDSWNGYKIAQPNIMVSQEKMEEDLEKEETVMDAKLIEDPIIHKMEEEIQEKQDIEPIETLIVVKTDISKDEE